MLSKKNRACAAGMLAVCGCFFLGLGAGLKFTSFVPSGPGITENADVDGVCKVKFYPDKFSPDLGATGFTSVHLTISGLLPNTTYGVLLDGDGSGISDPLAFTTNQK